MSLLSGLFGDATEVGSDTLEKELSAFLIEGEQIQNGYKLIRDLIVFTNWRLILVDKQGMTGKKREYTCVLKEASPISRSRRPGISTTTRRFVWR